MAVATAGVAAGTVIAEHLLHTFMVAICTSRFEHVPVPFLRKVQVLAGQIDLIKVTVVTDFCITFTRPCDQIGVGRIDATIFNAAMTFGTQHLAMFSPREGLCVYEYFFPRLQRSHRTTSTHAGRFALFRLFLGLCEIHQ